MSKPRQFDFVSMRYGDRIVPGVRIKCGRCGAHADQQKGYQKSFNDPDGDIFSARMIQGFERREWHVGKRPQDDRCPECAKRTPLPKDPEPMAINPVNQTTKPVIVANGSPPAEPERKMTRDESRIIFAKIEECYSLDTNVKGYQVPWTDQRIADDLGVPRVWVASMREQFFGAENSNAEIDAARDEAKALLNETKALAAKFASTKDLLAAMVEEAKKLGNRAEIIERKLANVEKTLR